MRIARPRPLMQRSTHELSGLAQTASTELLDDIRHELSHRNGRAARKLAERLFSEATDAAPSKGQESIRTATRKPAAATLTQRPRSRHPPTEEQIAALEKFNVGDNLKITAFAGAGKTSTLEHLADANRTRGLYLAFNKAIATEAASRFPSHVNCRTTHSIAVRFVRSTRAYGRRKLFETIYARELADILSLTEQLLDERTILTPVQQAHMILHGIRRFCNSADDNITTAHIDIDGKLKASDSLLIESTKQWIAAKAANVWGRMTAVDDPIPLGHDGYLKLWSLANPILDYSYVFVDEAQDTNPAVLHVFKNQKSAQMIYVGDRHQQIYEWRMAVNAMSEIETPQNTSLTQSFRFGPEIARAANLILCRLGETQELRGFDLIRSHISNGDTARAILARTNATVIAETLRALERERKPHIVGGTVELKELLRDVESLMEGKPGQRPEFFGFTNWEQVIEFAASDEGEPLRRFVTLVQTNGTGRLWAAVINAEAEEDKADVVISTAHKGKGREWASVRIAEDFSACQSDNEAIPEAELRLFYVAITRAKKELMIDPDLMRAFCSGRMADLAAIRDRDRR